jgi:hypothetical protein
MNTLIMNSEVKNCMCFDISIVFNYIWLLFLFWDLPEKSEYMSNLMLKLNIKGKAVFFQNLSSFIYSLSAFGSTALLKASSACHPDKV